jgi:hypothetical protein
VGSVVSDDVGEDVVDVSVDEAGAGEAGAQLVHQGLEPPVEGLRQLVRELGAGRAGRRVRLPLVRDAADRPNVGHHDLARVQKVQPLQRKSFVRHATTAYTFATSKKKTLY